MVAEPVSIFPVNTLLAMDAGDFATLIRESLGPRADPAIWEALTDPRVIFRTKTALGALSFDLQSQQEQANAELNQTKGKEGYFALKAEQAEWRQRASGLKRLVQRRTAFVRERAAAQAAAHPPMPPGTGKRMKQHNRDALERLTRAVLEHRRRVISGDGDETDDDTLWACLEAITAMTVKRGELPLTQWLDFLDEVREEQGQEDYDA